MTFVQFLKSLDELLFEIVTWLVFYPVTLWRTIRHPIVMMRYADTELADSEEEQYTDTLSPPVFLLLTLLLSHAIELALVGESPLIASNKGLARLITDDTSLLLVRVVFFSVFPLVLSTRLLRARKVKLTRNTLRLPFFALCYPTAMFTLMLGIGVLLTQLHRGPMVVTIGWAIAAASFVWFATVATLWFRRTLRISILRSVGLVGIGMVECLVAFVIVAPLIA